MGKEKAETWVAGKNRRAVIVEIIIPERVPADELAGMIHVALREKYPDLGPMEYHAFLIANLPLKDI
jgi:hypothetical protein